MFGLKLKTYCFCLYLMVLVAVRLLLQRNKNIASLSFGVYVNYIATMQNCYNAILGHIKMTLLMRIFFFKRHQYIYFLLFLC